VNCNYKNTLNLSADFDREIGYVIMSAKVATIAIGLPRFLKLIGSIAAADTSRIKLYSRCRKGRNRDVEEVKTSSGCDVDVQTSLEMIAKRRARAMYHVSTADDYVRLAVPQIDIVKFLPTKLIML